MVKHHGLWLDLCVHCVWSVREGTSSVMVRGRSDLLSFRQTLLRRNSIYGACSHTTVMPSIVTWEERLSPSSGSLSTNLVLYEREA